MATMARPSVAAPSLEELVQKYVRASHTVNVRGTVLSVHPNPVSVLTTMRRVVRRADGKSLSVTISPQAEKGVILADDGQWTSRYDPVERVVRKKRSLERLGQDGDKLLARLILRNYSPALESVETVAGRSCYRIRFQPKAARNVVVRVWMDRATGVELRRDELDAAGSTLSLVLYTSVSFPRSIPEADVTPRFPKNVAVVHVSRSPAYRSISDLSVAVGFPVRTPLSTPDGYEFVAGAAARMGGRTSALLRFTDGLLDLTLIETPVSARDSGANHAVRVVPRPYGETEVTVALDGLHVVVVGRGDPRDLVGMAEGLDTRRENAWRRDVTRVFNGHGPAVASMRNHGLPADTVVALLTVSSVAGRPAADVLRSYMDVRCWRSLARRWNVPESTVERRIQDLCDVVRDNGTP